jgi:hypothetical protein
MKYLIVAIIFSFSSLLASAAIERHGDKCYERTAVANNSAEMNSVEVPCPPSSAAAPASLQSNGVNSGATNAAGIFGKGKKK